MERELQAIRSYLEASHERHLARLQTWLKQPSVSVDGLGGTECAALLVDLLRDAGFPEAEVVRTPGIPGVWAAYDAGRPLTLVTYGMLDVRRADSKEWRAPPFAAEVLDHPHFPKVLIARGARSVKGPLGVWLNAVEACRAVLGAPPVNLLLLAEGDEILGSPHYRAMVGRYRERLATGDACWSPGASQDADGLAHLTLGYKGLIYLAVRASGHRWGRGPQDAPIHGMAGSVVDSPAWRLVQALSTLTMRDGSPVLADGFEGDAEAPTSEEATEMDAVRRRFAGRPWQQVLPGVQGATTPAIGDAAEDEIYRRYFFGSSVNLNGLRSGYLGPGTTSLTLPHVAEAFLDIRVPRVWDVRRVLDAVRARLDRPSKAPHLRQALRRSRQGHLPSESHQPAERRRLRVRLQRSLTLPHHGGNAKALPRALRRQKSGAQEPDQGKQNPRAAVLNFRENPLLGQPGNLHLKQQIPVKKPRKGHKHGLTGNQRGAKPTHLRPRVRNKRTQSVSWNCSNHSAFFVVLLQLYLEADISHR